jgi:DNA-binding transcriptional LysR family regulator
MRIKFDFTDLEAFVAVYDTGSFHLASDILGLSQSSVSRRIHKLEKALDTQLFFRTTRDVAPTLEGKRLKVRAEAILGETRETARSLRDESTAFEYQRARTLTIAIIPTVMSKLVAPAIRVARERHPDIRFRILDLSANEVAEAVAQGEADLGVCSVPAHQPGTTFQKLLNDQMVLAVPKGHRFASTALIKWSDLSGEHLILPVRGTGNRMLIDDALARAGLPLVWFAEVGRSSTALDLVYNHVGIAPLPSSAIDFEHNPHIAKCQIASPTLSRPIGLLTKAGRPQEGLAQVFSKLLSEII